MWRRSPAPFAAALALPSLDVISTSPELLLRTFPDGRVWTTPIKGTRPRGSDAASDDAKVRELENDPKERAELAMVVDVERNDLGRIARPGTVRQLGDPAVHTHATLHHRSVDLVAHVRPGVTRAELFRAMIPSGSVTGAPKVRAMELIAELEAERRGLYTGAIGSVAHDGTVELSMAIRTLTLREGVGRYFAGGGIVADSDPEREVDETRWKALQVLA
jgi:anthranilate/para-aminobenzoate synthase component I